MERGASPSPSDNSDPGGRLELRVPTTSAASNPATEEDGNSGLLAKQYGEDFYVAVHTASLAVPGSWHRTVA